MVAHEAEWQTRVHARGQRCVRALPGGPSDMLPKEPVSRNEPTDPSGRSRPRLEPVVYVLGCIGLAFFVIPVVAAFVLPLLVHLLKR